MKPRLVAEEVLPREVELDGSSFTGTGLRLGRQAAVDRSAPHSSAGPQLWGMHACYIHRRIRAR